MTHKYNHFKSAQYFNIETPTKEISEAFLTEIPMEIAIMPEGPAKVEALRNFTEEMQEGGEIVEEVGKTGKDIADKQNQELQKQQLLDFQMEQTLSSTKPFNLSKKSQNMFDDTTVLDTDTMGQDLQQEMLGLKIQKGSDLDAFLSSRERQEVQSVLEQMVSTDVELDTLRDLLEEYYSEERPIEKEKIANSILDSGILPFAMLSPETNSIMETPYTEYGKKEQIDQEVFSFVKKIEKDIRKLAESSVNKKKNKVFNLRKQAQMNTQNNIVMYGPDQVRVDPFSRMPASEWSIVERNKGFGLVVDDVWGIDWESVWRGNIMDKYSRPYRDKEGNWVGGYINKRFEVDRWIPEGNNMQLKPGSRRKPYLPEYGVTEARLVAQRDKNAEKEGLGPDPEKYKPFNWKEANTKNNIKTAATCPRCGKYLGKKDLYPGDWKCPCGYDGQDIIDKRERNRQERDERRERNRIECNTKEAQMIDPFEDLALQKAREVDSGIKSFENAVQELVDEYGEQYVVFEHGKLDKSSFDEEFAGSPVATQPSYRQGPGSELAIKDKAKEIAGKLIDYHLNQIEEERIDIGEEQTGHGESIFASKKKR